MRINPSRLTDSSASFFGKIIFGFGLLFSSAALNAQNCTINAGVDQTICANAALTLAGTKSGLFQGAGTTTWTQVSGTAVTVTSPNALTTTVTGFAAGSYTFRLSTTCQDGSPINDDVNVSVSPITIANAGADQTVCPGSAALAGNSPAPGTGWWGIIGLNNAGLTITTQSSATSALVLPSAVAGASTLRWTITQGACTSFDDVIITNRGGAGPVDAGPDQTLTACYSSTTWATMAASFAGNGSGGQGGTWSVVSGPNTPVFTFSYLNTTTVTNLIQGTYVLRWTASGACLNGYDDVQVTVPAPSSALTTANAGPVQVYCDGRSTVMLSGNAAAYAGETVRWQQVTGPAGAVITSPASPTTTVTGLNGSGTYMFQYAITNNASGCSSAAAMTVGYNGAPSITVNGGADYLYLPCGIQWTNVNYTFSGGDSTQCRIISAPTGYALPTLWSGSASSPRAFYGLTKPGTYIIRFQRIGGTGCVTAYDDVNVVVSQTPSSSTAGTYQTLACNVVSTSLAGNVPTVGTGAWSQVSGPNAATLANPASNTSGISGLANGRYVFKWIVTAGQACPASEDTVSVLVAATSPTAANAGADRTVCNASPVVLSGNAPVLNETGVWTVTPSAGVSFSSIYSPTATVNGLQANVAYTFRWTITNACGSNYDEAVITASPTAGPAQATAGADQCLASGTTASTLSGNAVSPVGATGTWSQYSGPSSAGIASPNAASTALSGLANGTYQFVRTFSSGGCASTSDTVLVTVSPAATAANAGADQTVCSATVALAGNNPTIGTGTWTQVSGPGGAAIASPSQYNTSVSGLQPGSYGFRWTIGNGGCAGNSDDVLINVSTVPSAAAGGPDQSCITSATATMAATAPVVGTGLWSQISGPAPAVITTAGATNTTVTGLANGTYTFQWTVTGGAACAANTDDVVVSVNLPASSGGNVSLCNTSTASLAGNANSNGTWAQISGPNTASLAPLSGYTASAENLITGSYVFRYTLTPAAGCTASSQDKTVTVAAPPSTAVAGTNQSVCNAALFGLNATAATTGTGSWTKVSGPAGGSFSSTSSPGANFNGAAAGLYTFQWTVSNAGCSNAAQVTVNNALPASAADAGADQSFCGSTATNMAAAFPSSGTGTWSQVSGPVTATVQYPALATTAVSGITAGTYNFRWTVTSGACAPTTDDVKIVVCGVLPVRLLLFEAEKKGTAVNLLWKTADEHGFGGFVVERSVGNAVFHPMASVPAKGGTRNDYAYAEDVKGLTSNKVYYRLKLIDANGANRYSEVKSIGLEKSLGLSVTVLTNPVKAGIVLNVESDKASNASVQLIDRAGKTVLQQVVSLATGNNVIALQETKRLANGMYVTVVQTQENAANQKLLIQR